MARNILLIEPNYKNKFPPIALMKISTYHKRLGDNVVFYKGEIKDFVLGRITDKCILELEKIHPNFAWNSLRGKIKQYIKTQRKSIFQELELERFDISYYYLCNCIIYFKDYYSKKLYLKEPEWDRIYVTTLFTFYFDITVKTINDLKPLLKPNGIFHVGGVLATLQPDEIEAATGIKPHQGLLNLPGELDNGTNEMVVDALPLDYTILEEIDYKYDSSNAYYAYTTRGCIRHCPFCAVPKLEPTYEPFIKLKERLEEVDAICGPKQELLLMDNNVIPSARFDDIIQEIIDCGFGAGATYIVPNELDIAIKNLKQGINDRGYIRKSQALMVDFMNSTQDKDVSYKVYSTLYDNHLLDIETTKKESLLKAYEVIKPFYEKKVSLRRPKRRRVDFNQGLDARLFNAHVADQFARIAVSPLRIAFDNMKTKEAYVNAITLCAQRKLRNFSNYLLYNFDDKPIDLYKRLKINVELCERLDISINSFPMKYHPLYGDHSHDRNYIGRYWNMKYIRSIQSILNATKGSIGRGRSFFYKAFGSTQKEYLELLELPDVMIIYRFFFEWLSKIDHPYSRKRWRESFNALTIAEKRIFFSIIHDNSFTTIKLDKDYGDRLNDILKFYVPLRDEIQEEKGFLYALKQEFDKIPKQDYIVT